MRYSQHSTRLSRSKLPEKRTTCMKAVSRMGSPQGGFEGLAIAMGASQEASSRVYLKSDNFFVSTTPPA
jgi:hypothetical protein